jgi:MarR family 2-MHQ and catechol resistance regulon transcriptional repressor
MKKNPIDIPRSDLDDLLFKALLAVYRFERQKINSFGLDYTAIIALQMLRRKTPQRMRELVNGLNLPFSSATRLFGKLEEAGYVKRVYAEDDRRGVHVYLTGRGEEIVKKIEDDTYKIISETSKHYDADTLNHFIKTANNMGRILGVENIMSAKGE